MRRKVASETESATFPTAKLRVAISSALRVWARVSGASSAPAPTAIANIIAAPLCAKGAGCAVVPNMKRGLKRNTMAGSTVSAAIELTSMAVATRKPR